eukprot:338046-Rhodomonas_salina.1
MHKHFSTVHTLCTKARATLAAAQGSDSAAPSLQPIAAPLAKFIEAYELHLCLAQEESYTIQKKRRFRPNLKQELGAALVAALTDETTVYSAQMADVLGGTVCQTPWASIGQCGSGSYFPSLGKTQTKESMLYFALVNAPGPGHCVVLGRTYPKKSHAATQQNLMYFKLSLRASTAAWCFSSCATAPTLPPTSWVEHCQNERAHNSKHKDSSRDETIKAEGQWHWDSALGNNEVLLLQVSMLSVYPRLFSGKLLMPPGAASALP